MLVKDIMTTELQMIRAEDTVATAAQAMKRYDIGALPIVRDNAIIGLVTDRDLTIKCLAEDLDPHAIPLESVYQPGLITCRETDSLEEAAGLMEQHRVRRLIVTDEANRPCGILSLGDLAVRGKNSDLTSEVMCCVAEH